MKAKDTITKILKEADKHSRDLADTTEGNFKQEDIDAIYQDAYLAIYQAGIREVVEWMETGAYFRSADKLCIHGYKAKLKELGIS